MTTYTTPHFATGLPARNARSQPALNRARPAVAPAYRPVGASEEATLMAEGPTPDWQPGAARGGVPKAAIGTLGAALVGGVALAIVLLAPSDKVTKTIAPDPIGQAAAQAGEVRKSTDVGEPGRDAPATAAAASADVPAPAPAAATAAAPAPVPAPVQAVIPQGPPVAQAPVAHMPRHAAAPAAAPHEVTPPQAPAATPDLPAPAAEATPPTDVQAPAMPQTPEASTVTPSTPAPVPAQPTPDTGSPAPVPAQ